jgi:co-chaperonin GroES (HSP10)
MMNLVNGYILISLEKNNTSPSGLVIESEEENVGVVIDPGSSDLVKEGQLVLIKEFSGQKYKDNKLFIKEPDIIMIWNKQ